MHHPYEYYNSFAMRMRLGLCVCVSVLLYPFEPFVCLFRMVVVCSNAFKIYDLDVVKKLMLLNVNMDGISFVRLPVFELAISV